MTHIWCQKWGSEDTTRHPLLTASDSLQNRGRDFPSMVQPFPGSPVPIPSQPPTGGCGDMLIRQNTPNVQPPQDKSGERIVSSIGAKKLILAGLHDLKSSSLSTVSVNHIILQSRVQSFLFNYPPPSKLGLLELAGKKNRPHGKSCLLHYQKKISAIAALARIQLNSQPKALVLCSFYLGKEGERELLISQ